MTPLAIPNSQSRIQAKILNVVDVSYKVEKEGCSQVSPQRPKVTVAVRVIERAEILDQKLLKEGNKRLKYLFIKRSEQGLFVGGSDLLVNGKKSSTIIWKIVHKHSIKSMGLTSRVRKMYTIIFDFKKD